MNYYYVFTMPDGTWLPARFRIEDRLTCRMSPIQFASEMQAARYREITRAEYLAMRSGMQGVSEPPLRAYFRAGAGV